MRNNIKLFDKNIKIYYMNEKVRHTREYFHFFLGENECYQVGMASLLLWTTTKITVVDLWVVRMTEHKGLPWNTTKHVIYVLPKILNLFLMMKFINKNMLFFHFFFFNFLSLKNFNN